MKRSQRDARKSKDLKRLIRKTGYSIAANNWRGALALAIVFGLLCSLAYAGIEYYGNYTASEASISVVYPEIADGTFPDGSRFTLYSLAGEDNIAAVLAQMQAEGKYTAFTTEELVRSVHARAIMDKELKETVTSMQSAGNAYSYFASEYEIDFAQPREKGRTLVEQLQEEDYSDEFLRRLIELDVQQIERIYGGVDSFAAILAMSPPEELDYTEWLDYYRTHNSTIRNYLNSLNRKARDYHSPETGKSVGDLLELFDAMSGERLAEIDNYIQNSGIALDRESMINKLTVQIEDLTLKYNKDLDKAKNNGYARDEYDHTFTENLIIVATSDDNGLYQARPKTVFDTVVNQFNDAMNSSIEYSTTIKDKQRDLLMYQQADANSAEFQRMDEKCRSLMAAYEEDQRALCELTRTTVEQFLSYYNNGYLSYEVERKPVISLSLVIKAAFIFVMGALVIVMLTVVASPLRDVLAISARRRKMRRIHKRASKQERRLQKRGDMSC